MTNSIIKILLRDLKTYNRSFSDMIYIAGIYIILVLVFPLSIGTSSEILMSVSPAILWVCALFTSISILDKFFVSDLNDGWFDQLLLSKVPLEIVVLIKALAHWISVGLPLILISPIVCLFFSISTKIIPVVIFSLTLGTMSLTLIGMMGAALVLGAQKTNSIIILLVLPLTLPILIFGVAAINAAMIETSVKPHLYLLAMCLSFLLAFSPIATAYALRIASE